MNTVRLIVSIICLLPCFASAATQTLLNDVFYQDQGDHIELEIRLGMGAEATGFTTEDDVRLIVTLEPSSAENSKAWSSAELSFDESDRLLEKVSLGGSSVRGYELVIEFSTAVAAELLPQFDDQQVLIKVTGRKTYRALSRFGKPGPGDPFSINLESRRYSIPRLQDIPRGLAGSHTVYLSPFEEAGLPWHHLRLGFFPDEQAAIKKARVLKRQFPDARVERVSEKEVRFAQAFSINPTTQVARASGKTEEPGPVEEDVSVAVALVTPSSIAAELEPPPPVAARWEPRTKPAEPLPSELDNLLNDAEQAFKDEDYPGAISLFTKLLGSNEEPYRQQALEMLGVAREFNRQLAHAKRHYETYLEEYPDTDGALRVQQRLSTLIALSLPRPESSLALAERPSTAWQFGANLSQFYQRHSLKIDDRSRVPIDGLFNDFNLMAQKNGTSLDQEVRVTMSYLLDFSDNERISGREYQVSSAFWEGASDRFRSAVRIGRQSRWDSGVLGRFDGLSYTYRPTGNLALGLTGGYLFDSSYDSPDGNRPFIGINGEFLSDSGNLSIKPFYAQQYVDGLLDRQAVGLQSQLYTEKMMLFSLVDYDIHHSALNNFTLTGNFTLGSSRVSASYEHRKNPYLTTRNALMGQNFGDLTALEEAILDLTLEEIASDRTATSDTMRIGWNAKLGQTWTLSADVVATDFSRTESSADVLGLEAHKTLYSSFQVRSNGVFGRGSYSSVMVRVADSQTSDTTSLYWDNRFTFASSWYLYPRFRLDHRTFQRRGDEQWSFRPSLRLDYRMSRRVRFELESGYEWTTRDMGTRELDISGVFVRAGYRANL